MIGSPPCTAFSQLQSLNPNTPQSRQKWAEGVEHLMLMMEIYRMQVREGRTFLHEHPVGAKSWQIAEVKKMARMEGVMIVEGDQFMESRPGEINQRGRYLQRSLRSS